MTTAAKKLSGKVALVTAGTRNLGLGIARALAEDGADVVLHYRGEQSAGEAAAAVREIEGLGVRAHLIAADLGASAEVRRLVREAHGAFGRLDILVNNAGKIVKKPLVEISEQEYDDLFAINAKAPFFAMQEAVRVMADGGRIISIGTTLLGATTPFYSVYTGSKAPLEDFSRALAREVMARGITVNVVAPGPIDTAFFHGQETAQSVAYVKAATGRLGTIDDMVPVVRFLASPEARWVTAQTLFVNGGYLAR